MENIYYNAMNLSVPSYISNVQDIIVFHGKTCVTGSGTVLGEPMRTNVLAEHLVKDNSNVTNPKYV